MMMMTTSRVDYVRYYSGTGFGVKRQQVVAWGLTHSSGLSWWRTRWTGLVELYHYISEYRHTATACKRAMNNA